MKLALIANDSKTVERLLCELLYRLMHKYEVVLLLPPEAQSAHLPFNIEQIALRHSNSFAVARELRRLKADVVLTAGLWANTRAGTAARRIRLPHVAVVLPNEHLPPDYAPDFFRYCKAFSKSRMLFFCRTSDALEFFQFAIRHDNIKRLCDVGVNTAKITELEYPAKDAPFVIAVPDVTFSPNETILLKQALQKASKTVPEISFKSVGFCYIEAELLDCSALFVPFPFDGDSLFMLTAAACGRPCIAPDTKGLCELIGQMDMGITFHLGEEPSMINGALGIYALPYDKRKGLGKHARKHVETFYNRKLIVETIAATLRSIEKSL